MKLSTRTGALALPLAPASASDTGASAKDEKSGILRVWLRKSEAGKGLPV